MLTFSKHTTVHILFGAVFELLAQATVFSFQQSKSGYDSNDEISFFQYDNVFPYKTKRAKIFFRKGISALRHGQQVLKVQRI